MKLHRYIIALVLLLGTSCHDLERQEMIQYDDLKTIETDSTVEKNSIPDAWNTVLYNIVIHHSDPIKFLKDTAKSLGLNIILEKGNLEITSDFSYQACSKSFIDIILDITGNLGLKIQINDVNGVISEDSVYLHIYTLKDLPGIHSSKTHTDLQSNFDSDKIKLVDNDYSNLIDYYAEIDSNLQTLFKNIDDSKYSINKQGGVLIVIADQKLHKQVSSYLSSLNKNMNDEILVEVNMVEVELDKGLSMGVNWKNLSKTSGLSALSFTKDNSIGSLVTVNNSIGEIFGLLKANYKKVKSISNPRMMIANNHSGIFKAVENYPYFDYRVDSIDVGDKKMPTQSKKVELKNATVGVTLYVHVIKLDDSKFKLYFKPSVTEISKEIEHDGYKYLTADQDEKKMKKSINIPKIPVLRTREMESTITLKNNQSIIIGGLIVEKNVRCGENIPAIISILSLGLLAPSWEKHRSELVILLTVHGSENINKYDYYQILNVK